MTIYTSSKHKAFSYMINKPLTLLTYNYIFQNMGVSETTAKRILTEIKNHYKPKSNRVLISHFNDYFNIPTSKNIKNSQ